MHYLLCNNLPGGQFCLVAIYTGVLLHVAIYRTQLTFEHLNDNKGEVNYAIYIMSSCLVEWCSVSLKKFQPFYFFLNFFPVCSLRGSDPKNRCFTTFNTRKRRSSSTHWAKKNIRSVKKIFFESVAKLPPHTSSKEN